MKINIIAVGKLKERYLKEAVQEYTKRLSRFCTVRIFEASDERASDSLSEAEIKQIKEKEAQRINKYINESTYVIALDLNGQKPDSISLANKIQNIMLSGKSEISFIIGGSLGIEDKVLQKADYNLCLSNLTFPHQLTRVILLEQIYRSFKINNNETYHK